MARKATKKAKTAKARTSRPKAKPKTKVKTKVKAKAKTKTKAKAKSKAKTKSKATSSGTSRKKVAKARSAPAKRKRSIRSLARKEILKAFFTGAGAKLAGKVGSAVPLPKTESAAPRQTKVRPLNASERDEFRELLLTHRRDLLGNVARMRAETLDKNRQDAAGNLSKFPTSPADLGSDNFELEFTLSLLESERELLKEIDEALRRIDQGVYGICEGTGQAIPRDRLRFEPWARYTVAYARLKEHGLASQDAKDSTDDQQ